MATFLGGLLLSACEQAPQPAVAQAPVGNNAVPLSRNLDLGQVAHGHTVFEQHCAECHGPAGKGPAGDWRIRDANGMFPPPPLDDSAHAWHHPTTVLLEVIREGSPQGQRNMPGWKNKLSEQDMQDVVVYIKSLWSDEAYQLWSKMEQQSLEP
jgi:mono/diheme cytochrome c family protein